MHRHFFLIGLLALAGCNKAEAPVAPEKAETKTAADVVKQASAAQIRPGEWEMTMEVQEMNIPGMPKGAVPPQLAGKKTYKTCMKQPDADFFKNDGESNCTYSDFSISGGRIKGTASCDSRSGPMTMTMDGEYRPESYDMVTTMAGAQLSMKMHTTGRRTGDCPST